MAFSSVPMESKSMINRAGEILVRNTPLLDDVPAARNLVERWRACHAYPINTFQATLRKKLQRYHDPIAAQRLKRMPTIIDKLQRYPTMTLTSMQDIAGIRAILPSVADVYRLADEYRNNRRFVHELIGQKDYIAEPKDEDGYRSLHLIYRYKNKQNNRYDGLKLEMQIRTKLQHTWATAVETMETFLGQALKSRKGNQQWRDFFAIVSSAFAHMENATPVPRFSSLSERETIKACVKAEAGLGALERMRGFSIAVNAIAQHTEKQKSWFYHLIVLKSLEKAVEIRAYDRDSFKRAVTDYGKLEAEAAQGVKIEPVLVSAGPIGKLRRAYPNFFLDIKEFIGIVNKMISEPS